jgi:hypothetical protein
MISHPIFRRLTQPLQAFFEGLTQFVATASRLVSVVDLTAHFQPALAAHLPDTFESRIEPFFLDRQDNPRPLDNSSLSQQEERHEVDGRTVPHLNVESHPVKRTQYAGHQSLLS